MTVEATGKVAQSCRTVGALIESARRQLTEAGIESATQEAVWLIDQALGLSGLRQVVDRNRVLSEADEAKVRTLLDRRAAREPLQYILGTQEFCGLEFEVNASVLIPRPETELLVRQVIRWLPQVRCPIIVDVGTGSGCLAVVLARMVPDAQVWAIDISTSALDTAKRNADHHGVAYAVTWLQGDLLAPLGGRGLEGRVSVIVSNPPYIAESDWSTLQPEVGRFEPRTALIGGPLGIEMHERLLDEAIPYLRPGGIVVLEVGQGQSFPLCERSKTISAYQTVETTRDASGIERALLARRAG